MKKLYCAHCGKFMAELRDASVRNGMVVLCEKCYSQGNKQPKKYDVPDFFHALMGKR